MSVQTVTNSSASSTYINTANESISNHGYKRYECLLTQTATTDPSVTVLYNDLDATPVWARSSSGVCTCTLSTSGFTAGKTVIVSPFATDVQSKAQYELSVTSSSVITLNNYNLTTYASIIPADTIVTPLFVEIRVYNS